MTAITERTRRQMFALLNERDLIDAKVQRAGMGIILGRKVESRRTLTEVEGLAIVADLQQRKRAAERDTPPADEPALDDDNTGWGDRA